MGYILGIDQGWTNTRAAVMDGSGNVLGYRRADGSYFPRVGIDAAMQCAMAAAEGALEDAGADAGGISAIVAGITGIDYEGDELVVVGALRERFGDKQIIACNDCEIAYYSGSAKPVGAVVCAGTGINAAIYAPGGGKFVMGDYLKASLQGGSAIARRAIEAVFESEVGMWPETRLTQLFCGATGDPTVTKLLQRFIADGSFQRKLGSHAPAVIALADDGDVVAQGVLEAFSDELCACVAAAMKKMGILELGCDIVLAGSVFKGRVNGLTCMVAEKLARSARNASIVNAAYEPVVGACIMGMAQTAGGFGERMARNAAASAARLGLARQAPPLMRAHRHSDHRHQ